MSNFKKGDAVRQVMPAPITGTVTGFSVDQDTGVLLTLVEFKDADGEVAENYFQPGQIEAAPSGVK
jgi:hypothetical protein